MLRRVLCLDLAAALAQLPGGTVFRRLSQEVEAAAAERHGGIKVYQLQVSITQVQQ